MRPTFFLFLLFLFIYLNIILRCFYCFLVHSSFLIPIHQSINYSQKLTHSLSYYVLFFHPSAQVDQGLGLGTKAPLFNRMTASSTRFVQLRAPATGSTATPITLVLHGRMGSTIGDLPVYDAFLLGGPYSVRGYNIGELAACRRYVEGAVEARVPLLGQQAYAFYEMGSDLGSSKEVAGNPTQYFRRVGQGSSMGGGMKLGALRAEAVRDNNKGKWHVLLAYGERF